jgi:hypothetical protein
MVDMENNNMTTVQQLKAEVKAAWLGACKVDGIDPQSQFVVFSNSVEAAAYNELMGIYLRACRQAVR